MVDLARPPGSALTVVGAKLDVVVYGICLELTRTVLADEGSDNALDGFPTLQVASPISFANIWPPHCRTRERTDIGKVRELSFGTCFASMDSPMIGICEDDKITDQVVVVVEILVMDMKSLRRLFAPLIHPDLSMQVGLASIDVALEVPPAAGVFGTWPSRELDPSIPDDLATSILDDLHVSSISYSGRRS